MDTKKLQERITANYAKIEKKQNTIAKKTAQIEKKMSAIVKKYNWNPEDDERHIDTLKGRGFTEEQASEISWTLSDISWLKDDIKRGGKEIEDIKRIVAKQEADLKTEIEKRNSRNVKAILDFLEDWKKKCMDYYIEMFPKFMEARAEWYALDREYSDREDELRRNREADFFKKRDAIRAERREAEKQYRAAWGWIAMYVGYDTMDTERIAKDLQADAEAKYDDIIERTNELIGTITDASGLTVNQKAGLDGYIKGERGTVKVSTVGAGGYNIQRFHFRTLIHKVG